MNHGAPAPDPPTDRRLPLSALRARLDPASSTAVWTIDPDGTRGRALLAPAPSAVTYPLALDGRVRFRARVRLLPHDWRDGRGTIHASLACRDRAGERRVLWSAPLRADGRGPMCGHAIDCAVPRETTEMTLGLQPGPAGYRAVARAIWTDAALIDSGWPTAPARLAHAEPSPTRPGPPPREPLISILAPVHDPPRAMLEEMIESVRAQTFDGWELCLIDDGSRSSTVRGVLDRAPALDPRIRLLRRAVAGGISVATNLGLEVARGAFVALLDHDDTLAPEALQRMAERLAAQPDLDMLYSDEDIVLDGRQVWVHLKPGWSPDTLRTNGYTCHLGVYRRDLVRAVGGFRPEYDGAQDVDMILRLTERTDRVAHVPGLLYHWRAHAGSTAGGDAKPYAYVAGRRAIAAHLERLAIDAGAGFGPPGLYRVEHRVDPATALDIVLAVTGPEGLQEAAESWSEQPYRNWAVALAAAQDVVDEAVAALTRGGLAADRIRTTTVADTTDRAAALSQAATLVRADYVLLLNRPARGLTHDWLTRLLGYAAQPGIAVAGGVLVNGDGRVLEGGIALPEGLALPLLQGDRTSMDRHFGYGTSVYNVLAVNDVLVTSASELARVGLRPQLGELMLTDLCLRGLERVVIVPDARLRALGPDVTVNDLPALRALHRTWSTGPAVDPYWNPGWRADRGDFEPSR